jgi:hypothetical protein
MILTTAAKTGCYAANGTIARLAERHESCDPSEMHLSSQAIREFQDLCRQEFDIELSPSDAEREALRVLSLFWLVLSDDPESGDGFDRL